MTFVLKYLAICYITDNHKFRQSFQTVIAKAGRLRIKRGRYLTLL